MEDCLNLTRTEIFDYITDDQGNEKRVKNPARSLVAQQKQKEIQTAFHNWVLDNAKASTTLADIYNKTKSNYVVPQWREPKIDHFPNASHAVSLRAHQKKAVWRGMKGSTIFSHAVGTGKTYLYSTLAMELRRTEQARKPAMIIVQGSTLNEFAGQFKTLYPTANILCPTKADREKVNRKALLAKIATGNWDTVILPHSFFDSIAVDPSREASFIAEQIEEIKAAITAEGETPGKGGRNQSLTVKQLNALLKSKEAHLKELANAKQDDAIFFEDLGIDALLVDEAHYYKKGDFYSKMGNVKGLDRSSAKKSFRFLMKTRAVQEKTGGKNIYLATGTPVSNTTAELWTILRYARPDLLKEYGVEQFDGFASLFGDTTVSIEQTETGDFKQVERFNKYVNGPELLNMWTTAADVILQENVPGWADVIPKLKNGEHTQVVIPRSDDLAAFIEEIRAKRKEWDELPGAEKALQSYVPLLLFNQAKQAAIDLRLAKSGAPDIPESKTNRAVQEVYNRWKSSGDIIGTQLVFCDMYHGPGGFDLYNDIKGKLVKKGIPENEIAIITDSKYDNDAMKERLFEQVNKGAVRVVIGSTSKLGIGVNAQERLIAIHHLDAPMRPMDFEQRNGRILRPGNTNTEVEIAPYVVLNTLDSVSFDRLQKKQKFINQVLRGNIEGRNFDDPADELQYTFEDLMAAASGNPLVKKKFELENRVRELEMLQEGHTRKQGNIRQKIHQNEDWIENREKALKGMDAEAKLIEDDFLSKEEPTFTIDGKDIEGKEGRKAYTEYVEAMKPKAQAKWEKAYDALDVKEKEGQKKISWVDRDKAIESTGEKIDVGYNGHHLIVAVWAKPITERVSDINANVLKYVEKYIVKYRLLHADEKQGAIVEDSVETAAGTLTSMQSHFKNVVQLPASTGAYIKGYKAEGAELKKELERPFAQSEDLKKARKEYKQVLDTLEHGADTVNDEGLDIDAVPSEEAAQPETLKREAIEKPVTKEEAEDFHDEHRGQMIELEEEAEKALKEPTKSQFDYALKHREKGDTEEEVFKKLVLTINGVEDHYLLIKPYAGQATLYSDPLMIQTMIRFALDTKAGIHAAMPHVEALGKRIFQEGKTTFESWSAAMKKRLGELWEKFKKWARDIWEDIAAPLKNERGEVILWDEKTPETASTQKEARELTEQETEELADAYETQKDIWIGNKDVRILEARVESSNLQKDIMKALGEKAYTKRVKDIDKAIQIYIDNQRNPLDIVRMYSRLTPEQKRIADLSGDLPDEVMPIVEQIQEAYKQTGLDALEADVIKNVLDNYASRVWDFGEGKKAVENLRKFGTKTRHAKQRKFATIVSGEAAGFKLKYEGATTNLRILKEEIYKTIEDKRFITALGKVRDARGLPLLSTRPYDNYEPVQHPNFTMWKWVGKAESDVTLGLEDELLVKMYGGKNVFIDNDGDVYEKKSFYAPKDQATNLNHILGISWLS